MLQFNKILFPLDYSEDCRALVPYVNEAALRFSSKLILLHALDGGLHFPGESGPLTESMENLRNLEENRLRDFATGHFAGVANVETLLETGDPATVIRGMIQHAGIDLVMMPTKGLGTFRRLLLGSVTSKVLHDVHCPVWTGVHSALGTSADHLPCRSILCAVGLDQETPGILKTAAAMAQSCETRLSILHVVETPPMSFEIDFAQFRKELMDNADLELRGMLRTAAIDAELIVLAGAPAPEVSREALKQQADLIIVGRGHDQGRIDRMFSQLYEIVREAPCPVLSV
ncbi:universal stress protein [Paludibaculum fermentans]|uniref:universal stress protein n=1 Tax=Paludibaculum fermentans TaxID=1473598 RepID=UPI003EBBF608